MGDVLGGACAVELAEEPEAEGIADVDGLVAEGGDAAAEFLLVERLGNGYGSAIEYVL